MRMLVGERVSHFVPCVADKGMPVLLLGCKCGSHPPRRHIKERVFSCGTQEDILQTNAMFSKALPTCRPAYT